MTPPRQMYIRYIPVALIVMLFLVSTLPVSAATSPWIQTDWSGGVGASTTDQFVSSTNIDFSGTAGQISQQTAAGAGAWYDTDWTYRTSVTIDADQVSTTLTNFPVYVDLSDLPAGFHSNVKSDGGDIRITQSDGTTEVAREIVSYNSSGDTGELHFLADSISSSTDTTFYIYYGNSAVSDYATSATYGRDAVWADYRLVLHLEDNTQVALDVSSQETTPSGMIFNNDGTVLYVIGIAGGDINEYTLSTPYDISTGSFNQIALDVSTEETSPRSMLFNDDGTTLYVLGATGDDINEYTLSTPYDISSGSFTQIALSVASQQTAPQGMRFNDDGTTLYVIGSTGDDIDEYTLSTPYDISSGSFTQIALSVVSQEDTPTDMLFNNDGTILYVIGQQSKNVNEYTLSTPYDISTGSFNQIALDVSREETNSLGMIFNNDGTVLYVIGAAGDDINEYSLSTAYDIASTNGSDPMDSTGNHTPSSWTNSISATGQGGQLGAGQEFDGLDDYLQYEHVAADNPGTGTFTVSTWFKMDEVPSSEGYILFKKSNYNTTGNHIQLLIREPSTGQAYNYQLRSTSEAQTMSTAANEYGGADDLGWHYTAWTRDAARVEDAELIIDGSVLQTLTTQDMDISGTGPIDIGRTVSSFANEFDGLLDEIRFAHVARSSDWLLAEYTNQKTPTTFYTAGSVAERPVLTSNIFDTEDADTWGNLTYTTSGTGNIDVKVRTGDQSDLSDATAFTSCTAISSGSDMSANGCVTDGHRYVQYQVLIFADTTSYALTDISIAFTTPNTAPSTPSLSAPTDTATDISANPTLTGSTYSDPESDVHADTQWQVDDNNDFSSPEWTRTAGSGEETTSVTSGNGTFANNRSGETSLANNTTYYVRVRYQDTPGEWSSYSSSISFTTTLAPITPSSFTLNASTESSAEVSWSANGNPSSVQYYAENTTAGTNSGWISTTGWESTSLDCGTEHTFSIKARNKDQVESSALTGTVTTGDCQSRSGGRSSSTSSTTSTSTQENKEEKPIIGDVFLPVTIPIPPSDDVLIPSEVPEEADIEADEILLKDEEQEESSRKLLIHAGDVYIPTEFVRDGAGTVTQRITVPPETELNLSFTTDRDASEITGMLRLLSTSQGVAQSPSFIKRAHAQEQALIVQEFSYSDSDGDGIWTADITTPTVAGTYEILTFVSYIDAEGAPQLFKTIAIVDPEGYIYSTSNGGELRIKGAVVSLFVIHGSGEEVLWNAESYGQNNPITTDKTGTYSFIVPPGTYKLTVEAEGYELYEGEGFNVEIGKGIHENIELSSERGFLGTLFSKIQSFFNFLW